MEGWKTRKYGIILIDYFHLKFSHKPTIKTAIKSISPVSFSRIFTRKIFCKLLSKYLWQSLFLTPLDRYICIVMRSILFQTLKQHSDYKSLIAKTFGIENEGCKCCLGNKEQKVMFLVVSRSDVQFGFEHPFFACPIRRANKIAHLKNRALIKKFVHSCCSSHL